MISTVFNDLASIGNIALKVNTHTLMENEIEVVMVPTSIFSSHMGYKDYVQFETPGFNEIVESIEKIYKKIEGVLIGYVVSDEVKERISLYLQRMKPQVIILDPILGDNGSIYRGTTKNQIKIYQSLASIADIITPNLTEALVLTGNEVGREKNILFDDVKTIADQLYAMGPSEIVIKSILRGDKLFNLYFDGKDYNFIESDYVEEKFHGTGDVFVSLLLAAKLKGKFNLQMMKKIQDEMTNQLKINQSDELIININIDNI